ncbi:hypothetical protein [Kitasatospora sp. NPDC050543]|uniref:hypothetical protein n=1 Tax=Kitasatospora sp. NPDC050543 TaxID=3364054 RepID=UPI00378C0463
MGRLFAAGKIIARQAQNVAVSPEAIGLFGEPHPKPGPDTAAHRRTRVGKPRAEKAGK